MASTLRGFREGVKKARRNLEGAIDAVGSLPARRFVLEYRSQLRTVREALTVLQEARKLKPALGARDPDLAVETAETLNAQLQENVQTARLALRRTIALLEDSSDADVIGVHKLRGVAERALQVLKVLT